MVKIFIRYLIKLIKIDLCQNINITFYNKFKSYWNIKGFNGKMILVNPIPLKKFH